MSMIKAILELDTRDCTTESKAWKFSYQNIIQLEHTYIHKMCITPVYNTHTRSLLCRYIGSFSYFPNSHMKTFYTQIHSN